MDEEYLITETEWGLLIKLRENLVVDDNNIIEKTELLISKCKELGKKAVILDASTIVRETSVLKFLEVAELIKRESLQIKIAVVAPHLVDEPNSKTFETFSMNRGVFIKYFANLKLAEAWILTI